MEKTTYYFLDQKSLSYEDFGGEMVAINFDTGKYYGLTGTALAIWNLLIRPRTEEEIVAALEQQYVETDESIAANTRGFLDILKAEGLLIALDAVTDLQPAAADTKQAFTIPALEVHSDLQELIMLDPVHDADPEHGWPVRKEQA